MALYYIDQQTLTDIADAIRLKTSTTSLISPRDMANMIASLSISVSSDRAYELIERTAVKIVHPSVTSIAAYAFASYSTLEEVVFPNCTYVGELAFRLCTALSKISFPACETIGRSAFQTCTSLSEAYFPACTTIMSNAFHYCSALQSIYLHNDAVVSLQHSNAFADTPIVNDTFTGQYGTIYVPASLISEYRSAYQWQYFSERFSEIWQ